LLLEEAEPRLRDAEAALAEADEAATATRDASAPEARAALVKQAVARERVAQAAFLLDLQLKLTRSTETFRWWQQIVSWAFGLGGLMLALTLAWKEFDSTGGWVAVVVALVLSVVASFRGPVDIRLGNGDQQDATRVAP
jgi:hypothetical protein